MAREVNSCHRPASSCDAQLCTGSSTAPNQWPCVEDGACVWLCCCRDEWTDEVEEAMAVADAAMHSAYQAVKGRVVGTR
jgi:hypothetical protein